MRFAREPRTGAAAVLVGQLYYRDELRTRLLGNIEQDIPSDAALALAVFRDHGPKGLEWLEGEFALIVFDAERQCLFAMRDPLGSWPLYWCAIGQAVRVSTSLLRLAQQHSQATVNLDALATFLTQAYAFTELDTEQTALAGVYGESEFKSL